jgi:hypothetical protein
MNLVGVAHDEPRSLYHGQQAKHGVDLDVGPWRDHILLL